MKKVILMAMILGGLAGCEATKTVNVTPTDLYGSYTLVSFDNARVNTEANAKQITFAEGADNKLKIQGIICNTFIGQASLQKGQLLTDGLASTRMLCVNTEDSAMESAFGSMFNGGPHVLLKGASLTLEGEGHQFIYQKSTSKPK